MDIGWFLSRLVVLESGLGLESGLKSVFAGLGLGLGLESYGLGLGLGGSASKSLFKSVVPTRSIAL